jgi:hypothetical protein
MEIRQAALQLLGLTGMFNARDVLFAGGTAAMLEAAKIARRHSDPGYGPNEAPVIDWSQPKTLCGIRLVYDPEMPLDGLTLVCDGRAVEMLSVDVTDGCRIAAEAMRHPPRVSAVEPLPDPPLPLTFDEPPAPKTKRVYKRKEKA